MSNPKTVTRALVAGVIALGALSLTGCNLEEQAIWHRATETDTFIKIAATRSPGAPSDATLARLRACESHGNYGAVNRSGTYRGAYQFSRRTWNNVAGALQTMADQDVGLVVVLDQQRLVGVVSERDCARRAALARKPLETTPVSDVMTREVVTVDFTHTYADCLRLMHQHAIRHLPVVERGNVIAVVSIRDLLREAVAHNSKIIAELERERLSLFTSMA
jgi:CBS-domain-containing membrane protein